MRHPLNQFITAEVILNAYHHGFFPMSMENGEIGFYTYPMRGVLPLDQRFKVRRSLRQVLNRGDYEVTRDKAPREVLQGCSRIGVLDSNELWLSEELIDHYMTLFDDGYMHTLEVWKNGALIGGLYGMVFGGAFVGESMFSKAPFGSQIALVHLVEHLRNRGFTLLDAQMASPHLKQFGLYEISQDKYLAEFHKAMKLAARY
jgi:leucyl/phenylalanyl-tRNA---protein transferase